MRSNSTASSVLCDSLCAGNTVTTSWIARVEPRRRTFFFFLVATANTSGNPQLSSLKVGKRNQCVRRCTGSVQLTWTASVVQRWFAQGAVQRHSKVCRCTGRQGSGLELVGSQQTGLDGVAERVGRADGGAPQTKPRQRPDQDFMAFLDVGPHGFLGPLPPSCPSLAGSVLQGPSHLCPETYHVPGSDQGAENVPGRDTPGRHKGTALPTTAVVGGWPLSHTEVMNQLDLLKKHIAEGNNLAPPDRWRRLTRRRCCRFSFRSRSGCGARRRAARQPCAKFGRKPISQHRTATGSSHAARTELRPEERGTLSERGLTGN